MSELSRLEHDRIRSIEDLGIETAHDARESNRLLAVTDHEVFGGQRKLLFVESDDLLAFFCAADMDLTAFEVGEIECMHRLAEFF